MSAIAYELVPRENADGHLGGSDYGSSVRVLVRSPSMVLFSAVGLSLLVERDTVRIDHHSFHKLAKGRLSAATIEAAREEIEARMGAGMTEVALAAWRKRSTALVDGGGKALSPTRVVAIKAMEERKALVTCDWSADLRGRIATCKQCGQDLKPDTDYHRIGWPLLDDHPRSVADCQRRTNKEVVGVHGFTTEAHWSYVDWFVTWDGESTTTQDFCSNACAATYGRRAVQALAALPVGGQPEEPPRREREYHDLNPKETKVIEGPDGRMILV